MKIYTGRRALTALAAMYLAATAVSCAQQPVQTVATAEAEAPKPRENTMQSLVTQEAPDFTAQAVMPDNTFGELTLSQYRGKYVVLFFYPLDFTFVCPTEILAFDREIDKFESRDAQVIGISVDSEYTHFAWRNTAPADGGIGQIHYPLVSDLDKSISRSYGILSNESMALRGTFLIDKEGIVRHALVNDPDLGRNTDETLRTLDALIFVEGHSGVCPANWQQGQEAVEPTAEGVAEYLSTHSGGEGQGE